jgi:hypothetical protein
MPNRANRQQAVAKRGGRIVAAYYEIETGTSHCGQRGKGTNLAGYRIPIPRARGRRSGTGGSMW